MADTTIKTRVKLKYDSLANWTTADPILLKGEVALVDPGTTASDGSATVLIKVGNGTSKFSELDYAWGKAADVYAWAKAANKPTYTAAEVGVNETNFPGLRKTGTVTAIKLNGSTFNPTSGVVDLGSVTTNISGKQDKVVSLTGFTATTVEDALLEAKKAGTDAQATANSKYSKPTGGIPKSDLASAVQTSLGKADTSVQSVSLASGTNNGTIKLTVNGTATDNIAVKGLGSAAYTASNAYATAAQGTKADNAMPKSGGTFTGAITLSGNPTANLHAATKQYVDSAIGGVTQFDIQKFDSFDKLPTTGKKGVIYIVPDNHSDSNDSYDEYIWNTTIKTPAYEKIGNTDVNLSAYAKTADVNNALNKKQDKLTTAQLNAVNSGITSTKVSNYDGYAAKITTLEGKPGLDKVGTVTGIKMNGAAKTVASDGSVDLGTVITAHQDISGKQDKLTAGTNITIKDNVISSSYTNTNQTIGVGSTTFGANDLVKLVAGSNVSLTPNTTNKQITIAATNTDTKVTSAANHYTPAADSAAQLSVDASSTTSATWGSTSLVTGVNLQRDAKGHVVGVTVDSIRMPGNPNTDTKPNNAALKDATGATIFTANASADQTIVCIDCGDASTVI